MAGLRFFHWLYHRIISPDRVDRLQIELEEAKDERQGSAGSAGSSVSVYEKDKGKFHNFLPPDPDPDPCGPPHHHHHDDDDHRHPSIFMNTRHCFQQEIHISMQGFEGFGLPPGFFSYVGCIVPFFMHHFSDMGMGFRLFLVLTCTQ